MTIEGRLDSVKRKGNCLRSSFGGYHTKSYIMINQTNNSTFFVLYNPDFHVVFNKTDLRFMMKVNDKKISPPLAA